MPYLQPGQLEAPTARAGTTERDDLTDEDPRRKRDDPNFDTIASKCLRSGLQPPTWARTLYAWIVTWEIVAPP
jgi:hypothetical protein